MKMKRKIACIMSVVLLLTSPAGVVFASDNGDTGDVWIADESSVGETIVDCEPETVENLSTESESEDQQNMESETAEPQSVEPETEEQQSPETGAESDEESDEASLVASVEEIQPDEIPDTALADSDAMEEAAAIAEETGVSVLESGTCGANLTWTFDSEGTLTISGTGDMDDAYDTEESPWGHLFYYGFDDEENGWIRVQAIVIEDGVTSIGAYAFALDYRFLFWDVEEFGAENVQPDSVTIADSVTRIGEYAFLYSMPDSITLSANVTDIGEGAFETVGTLKEINVSADNPVYCSVEGVLYNKAQTELICCPRGKEGTLVIPDTVTDLNDAAFYGCVGLTSISLPEGITAIGEGMFSGCSGLLEVIIPDSVTQIGDGAFSGCKSLTDITIPAGVTEIGSYAFRACSALTEITIPDGVTDIGERTFSECSSLSKITLPDSVTSIGSLAFYNCSSLVEFTIPDSLTSIVREVFLGCTSLTTISVSEDNPVYSSQNGVLFNKDGTVLVMYPVGKSGVYVIPEGVTAIGDYAFSGCDGLTSVTMPDCVVDVGEFAFYYCMNLKTATLSSGIAYINPCAFAGCVKLTDIYIPVSVTGIGEAAFSDCRKLANVYYGGDQDAWSAVSIGSENKRLKKATLHYNTVDVTGVAAFLSTGKISSLTNTASGITLEWSEISGADGYYVYRKTSSGKYKKIKTIESAATVSYTDTAVKDKNGVTYSYKVIPYVNGSKGKGEARTIIRLTGASITSVTNTASGKIKVKWTQVSDVTGYQVKIVSTTIKKKVSASKKSVTLTGSFTEGKNYYICIRTYKKVDGVVYYSAWSSKVTIKITK